MELESDVVELPLGVPHPQHEVDGALVLGQMLLSDRGLNEQGVIKEMHVMARHQILNYQINPTTPVLYPLDTWAKLTPFTITFLSFRLLLRIYGHSLSMLLSVVVASAQKILKFSSCRLLIYLSDCLHYMSIASL